jgi:hypothetical protein
MPESILIMISSIADFDIKGYLKNLPKRKTKRSATRRLQRQGISTYVKETPALGRDSGCEKEVTPVRMG